MADDELSRFEKEKSELRLLRTCRRCGKTFSHATNTGLPCSYHPGEMTPLGITSAGVTVKAYTCCGAPFVADVGPDPPGCTPVVHTETPEDEPPYETLLPILTNEVMTRDRSGERLGEVVSPNDVDIVFSMPAPMHPTNTLSLATARGAYCELVRMNMCGMRKGEADPYGIGCGWEDSWDRGKALAMAYGSDGGFCVPRTVFKTTGASVDRFRINSNVAALIKLGVCQQAVRDLLLILETGRNDMLMNVLNQQLQKFKQ